MRTAARSRSGRTTWKLWRQRTHAALEDRLPATGGHAVWPAFAEMVRRHRMPAHVFDDVIAGQRQDLESPTFETFDQLYEYCYRVAGVVGLASIYVWGFEGGAATEALAVKRGVAFQLTNILRDLREDAARGRIYLPREELAGMGIDDDDLRQAAAASSFLRLMRFQIARAEAYYDESAALEGRHRARQPPDADRDDRDLPRPAAQGGPRPATGAARARVAVAVVQAAHRLARGAGELTDFKSPNDANRNLKSQTLKFRPSDNPRIIIVGGGLAGMAAARRAGVGRRSRHPARSPPRTGRPGQLVRGAADRRGARQLPARPAGLLHQPDRFLPPAGRRGLIRFETADSLPRSRRTDATICRRPRAARPAAPGPDLLRFAALTWGERLALSRAMLAMLRLGRAGRLALADVSFGHWLDEHRQPAVAGAASCTTRS